ncbi:DUF5319 family protein [Actinokineospora sp. PR83]|uniref:DUF5319 family protein n=1 Tax=Actinokineospora sp. PR83 TaxID=2884908 RepID=UPI0035ABDA3E
MLVPHDAVPPNPFSGDGLPPDPFHGDPEDPARALDEHHDHDDRPMTAEEREDLVGDLADLAVYQALLEPRGLRGIVVDCGECDEPHYHDWELLASSLQQLLDDGRMRPHEPAFDPDPECYVSWEYCRGFADGVTSSENAH